MFGYIQNLVARLRIFFFYSVYQKDNSITHTIAGIQYIRLDIHNEALV